MMIDRTVFMEKMVIFVLSLSDGVGSLFLRVFYVLLLLLCLPRLSMKSIRPNDDFQFEEENIFVCLAFSITNFG